MLNQPDKSPKLQGGCKKSSSMGLSHILHAGNYEALNPGESHVFAIRDAQIYYPLDTPIYLSDYEGNINALVELQEYLVDKDMTGGYFKVIQAFEGTKKVALPKVGNGEDEMSLKKISNSGLSHILKSGVGSMLKEGEIWTFGSEGNKYYPIDIQIFLSDHEGNINAAVEVQRCMIKRGETSGHFKVIQVYTDNEKATLSKIFRKLPVDY